MVHSLAAMLEMPRILRLRGLRHLPFALFLAASSITPWFATHGRIPYILALLALMGTALATILLPQRIDMYYSRQLQQIGYTEQKDVRTTTAAAQTVLGFVVLLLIVGGFIFLPYLHWPIDPLAMCFGIALLIIAWRSWSDQKHYALLGLVLMLLSCLPWLGLVERNEFYADTSWIGLLRRASYGLMMMFGSVGDHLAFRRTITAIQVKQ